MKGIISGLTLENLRRNPLEVEKIAKIPILSGTKSEHLSDLAHFCIEIP